METRICRECGKEFEIKNYKRRKPKFCSKSCFKEFRRKYMNEFANRKRQEIALEFKKKIGDKCIICASSEKLVFHEKNGKNHEKELKGSSYKFFSKADPQAYVPMCRRHHVQLHFLISNVKDVSELEKLFNLALFIKLQK